jgi:pimeloyl-ACP methyl ester carboxylesterase
LTTVPPARLARHVIRLADGHRVQLAVSGRGVPLVVVHGFTAEGVLYAQTLSRLVAMGFQVVAIDTAAHGGTAGLADAGGSMRRYAELLGRVVDAVGIRRAVLAGHSMGGRLVVELAARRPELAIAVLPVDAIVGAHWDNLVNLSRVAPGVLAGVGAALLVDSATTLPVMGNPEQAAKLVRLLAPMMAGHVRRPFRLVAPGVSILRSSGSRWMLERLGEQCVPVAVIHGACDLGVPVDTARSAAAWSRGQLVVVHGATHSWLLKDPETLPAVTADLLRGPVGDAVQAAVSAGGVDPDVATAADAEQVLLAPRALVRQLSPTPADGPGPGLPAGSGVRPPGTPGYRWSITTPR